MSDRQLHSLVHHLCKAVARQGGGLADAELLDNFVRRRDEAAFEVLVWRHGSMVLSVCRRVLRDAQDAEDAFQATFLVLARKAAGIGTGASLAGWLYRVAYRVALRARSRTGRVGPLPEELPAAPATEDAVWRDLRPVLDEEVNRLPEKYRLPVVLCYLQGHTNEEAARQLGCPRGTILSRLARARDRLRARLTRRGLALAASGLATVFVAEAEAAVPVTLVRPTVGAATAYAAGKAAGVVPAHVIALSEGVIHAMFLTRVQLIGAAVLAVIVTATGASLFAQREAAPRPAAPAPAPGAGRDGRPGAAADLRGLVRAVDAAQNTLTVFLPGNGRNEGDRREEGEAKTFAVAKDALVFLDDGRARRFCGREGTLADVAAGATVTLRLAGDQKTVDAILAEGPTVGGKLSSVDVNKNTLTVSGGSRGREEAAPAEQTYTVGKNAEIVLDDGRGRRTSAREATLGGLPPGCLVMLKLSPNQKEVVAVSAEGPNVQGTVKAVDAGKQTLTLTAGGGRGGEGAEERTYVVAANADILVEDDRPRRFFPVREGKLADVPVGAVASLKLSPDQNSAVSIRAEGPQVAGALKGTDPGKGTVIVVIGGGRGTDGEQRTYTVAKDVQVMVDGAEAKFADLKGSEPPLPVSLKLAMDGQTVRSIHVGTGRR